MSPFIPILAANCQVPTNLCDVTRSQEVIKVRPAEFIRLKHSKIWPHEGEALHCLSMKRKKMAPILETHNSVCLSFCQETELTEQGCPESGGWS